MSSGRGSVVLVGLPIVTGMALLLAIAEISRLRAFVCSVDCALTG